MSKGIAFQIESLDDKYRDQAVKWLKEAWGDSIIVTRGNKHDSAQLSGFVVLDHERMIGVATYHLQDQTCELVSINSLRSGVGIGTALLNAVIGVAMQSGCRRTWLITTNDNINALRFYQKRGFALVAIYRNALEYSRKLKPQIPLFGEYDIPLRDEIELEMVLEGPSMPEIICIHHTVFTIPAKAYEEGKHFYCDILGMSDIGMINSGRDPGGFWLRAGNGSVCFKLEDPTARLECTSQLYLEVSELLTWKQHLDANGIEIKELPDVGGYERFETRDPFGNQIEFIGRR